MTNPAADPTLTPNLIRAGVGIGVLARDDTLFRGAVDAFRAADGESFQRALGLVKIDQDCDLICRWIRVKECVLRCIELCGPPIGDAVGLADIPAFADIIAKITGDEELIERLADAVEDRDGPAFKRLVGDLKIERFCHLLCYWACQIHSRLLCEIVCDPIARVRRPFVSELAAAGAAVGTLAQNRDTLAQVIKGVEAVDCKILSDLLGPGGHCVYICEWICSWHCVLSCLRLCAPFPISLDSSLEEMRAFAVACERIAATPGAIARLVDAVGSENADAYASLVKELQLESFCVQLCHWICFEICRIFCFCVCPNPALLPWFTTVGYFDIYGDIDPATGKTNKGLAIPMLGFHGGPKFAFYSNLQFGGFCPATSPGFPGVPMKYRFTYDIGDGTGVHPITSGLVSPVEAGTRLISWPQNLAGFAGPAFVSTFQTVMIGAAVADPIAPAPGDPWVSPAAHVVTPDAGGWVTVDANAIGGGYQVLLGFDSATIVPGGPPAPGVLAGTAVPGPAQRAGKDLAINFEATRVGVVTVDYSNGLSKIHINNWIEVNELWFAEFGTNCCTPINASLSVQFTVDHEEMDAGAWSLAITSCSTSAPGDITPLISGGGVTVQARGGFGTIAENTSLWSPCSYTATLTTRPALTTGLVDRPASPHPLTFCICGH